MEALKTYTVENTVAEKMNERLSALKMTKAEAALRMNYSRSALSQYLNGKYAADPTEIEKKIEWFLMETSPERIDSVPAELKGSLEAPENWKPEPVLGNKVEYFESTDYVQVIGLCQACQEQSKQGLIIGRSGYGKSHALKRYAKLPRTAYIECNEAMNQKDLVRKIERAVGIPKTYGSIDERMEVIADFFNANKGYVLIVDEADKLITKYTQKKIEQIRYISDQAKVGIVLAGEPMLATLLKTYDERYANRMSYYYELGGLGKQEVLDYLEAFDMDENVASEFLSRATNPQTGCFRLLDRTLDNVLRLLRSTGKTRITMKLVSEASNMMMM